MVSTMRNTPGVMAMRVRVLGEIEAREGQPQLLGGPTQRRVFAALVARRGATVSMAELLEICWPDDDQPERAEHNVRTYVHRLRTALGDDGERIETASNGYRLTLDADELDIDRYEGLALAARQLFATGEHVEALDQMTEAETLWTGRPYGEFADDNWALPEVARLMELHWATNELQAEALLAVGQPANAVTLLEALIRSEPLRERPRSLLMRALYEAGRHAEALRAFQDFRRLLVDEIGVEPSPDLIDLDRAIASGELNSTSHVARTVGSYELKERIGEGAFAVVHRATQSSLGRDVAVKIVRAELANQPEFIRRFEAEAQMVASIEHPHIVPLYDYWREPGQAFLVMRWMTGGSLEGRLDAGPIELQATLDLIDEIAAALTASHNQGVVHRDVKPANILFDDAGRAYLGDFGIALTVNEMASPHATLSEGSPIFAAPEQLRREPVGPEADVYALAIVAFNALAGRTPFADAPNEAVLLRRQLNETIPALSTARPGLPAQLDRVLATATAKLPGDRYPSATSFSLALRAAASGKEIAESRPAIDTERVNPYLGLRAFTETDTAAFHGRARLIDELVDHLAGLDNNLLAIVGPSGSGKSSVVRAGLIPALRQGRVEGSQTWFTTTMTPGAHPFEALETALLRIAVNPPASLLDQLRDGDRGLLRSATRVLPDDHGVLVIVVDQFEELFTTGVSAGDRDLFLRALCVAMSDPVSRVRVVLTLRADFYDEPLRHPGFAPFVKEHTKVITPLAPDELEEAITLPAASVGVGFEPGLVAEIIADANSQPGALPLLQFALTQAFDQSTGSTISIDDYRSVGGLSGALGRRAESLLLESDIAEQEACRRLFGRLVTLGEGTEDTRRRLRRSELPTDESTDAAIERFGNARLLTFDRDAATREPTLEIAHEALIREWTRMRGWMDDDRDTLRTHRHLTVASTGWINREQDPNELYRGARLDAAEPLLAGDAVRLNSTEVEFLQSSLSAQAEEQALERRRLTRLRRLVGATAVIAVFALIAGGVAFSQKGRADDQALLAADNETQALANADEATRNAERADERADAAESAEAQADLERIRAVVGSTATESNRLAALLAVEAYRLDPSVESLDVLHRVLTAVPGLRASIASDGRYFNTGLLADGVTLVAVSGVAVEVWDLETRTLIRSTPLPEGSDSVGLDIAADSAIAAVKPFPDQILLFDATTGETLSSIQLDSAANGMDLSRTGSQLVVAVEDGKVEIWDVADAELVTTIETDLTKAAQVRWNPANDRVAVISGESIVQYWDPSEPEPLWTSTPEGDLSVLTQAPLGVLFTSDGTRLALDSGFLSGRIRVMETSDGSLAFPTTARTGENAGQGEMYWADEGRLILAAPSFQRVPLYDLTTGEDLGSIVEGMKAEDTVYSPELDQIIASGALGFEVWSVDGSGPLERAVPYSDEQREALERNGGTAHVALAADGSRVIVSVFALPDRPATTSFDLTTERNQPGSFPHSGSLAYSNGPNTMHFDYTGFQLLDADDQPYGVPVPLTLDMTDQAASADGRFIVIGRAGGFVDLYTSEGELVANLDMELIPGDGNLIVPSLSDDGRAVAATTEQGTTVVWSTETLERLDVNTGGRGRLVGNWLWAFDGDSVQRFDPWTNERVGVPFFGQEGGVFYPVVDETNGRAAIMGPDLVRIFDLDSGKQLGRELPYKPMRITYTADGSQLAVANDNRVSIWNYDTDTWADLACQLAGSNFTVDEWEQLGPRTIDRRATCEQFPLE